MARWESFPLDYVTAWAAPPLVDRGIRLGHDMRFCAVRHTGRSSPGKAGAAARQRVRQGSKAGPAEAAISDERRPEYPAT